MFTVIYSSRFSPSPEPEIRTFEHKQDARDFAATLRGHGMTDVLSDADD